jgi:hypothetical protein
MTCVGTLGCSSGKHQVTVIITDDSQGHQLSGCAWNDEHGVSVTPETSGAWDAYSKVSGQISCIRVD